mmetsp:Transcript_30911/g.51454  ORF Transcript_30911/g.51454 Transcript_30911/m.51454 type:complete len:80 (+) Transcript_30911:57-296(+)
MVLLRKKKIPFRRFLLRCLSLIGVVLFSVRLDPSFFYWLLCLTLFAAFPATATFGCLTSIQKCTTSFLLFLIAPTFFLV